VNEERLGSPAQFSEDLAAHLARFADATLPLPSRTELLQLIEVMFYASLHEEEGRLPTFNVAWQPGSDGSALFALATPLRVTPKNLAKLAPATRRDATSIAVRPCGDQLVAWALLQRSVASAAPLTIWVIAPGILRVDYAGAPRAQ